MLKILENMDVTVVNVYIAILRYLVPALVALLLFRCIKPLVSFRKEPEIWAWIRFANGERLPVTHWENVIGRAKRSDIVINDPKVSKTHAVLTRYDDGSWSISSVHRGGDIRVNGKKIKMHALNPKDVITIGDVSMTLFSITEQQEAHLGTLRTKAATAMDGIFNLTCLTAIQVLICLAYLMNGRPDSGMDVLMGFGGIVLCQWLLYGFYLLIKRTSFELETIAFFLCTMGMTAIAVVVPWEVRKQLISMILGLGIYMGVGWCLRDLDRAKIVREIAVFAGVGFLVITLLFGTNYNGAKNWLMLGGLSVQPSEFSKICFAFVAASTMDVIVTKRNLVVFIVYSALICLCLAIMSDFGTALIFFVAFLVGAYMRSGSIGTIGLACASLGYTCVIGVQLLPTATRRFSTWRHIWEDTSYQQQTQAIMCMAAGGFLGLGPGNGKAKYIFASDSDIVVATLSEEWGLVMILMLVACILALALFATRSSQVSRSAFYTIGACTAASSFVVQALLNALGTVDVVPLTGVTFPFVSNGGSSMLCSWGLLAFVKAADTRQNASFAVRLPRKGGKADE